MLTFQRIFKGNSHQVVTIWLVEKRVKFKICSFTMNGIGLDEQKNSIKLSLFSFPSIKTNVLGAQKNRLI